MFYYPARSMNNPENVDSFKVFQLLMNHVSDMLHPPSCKEERRRGKFEFAERAVTGRKREKEKRRVVRMFRKLFLLNRHGLFHHDQGAEKRFFPEARFHGGQIFEDTQNIPDLERMLVLIPFRAMMKSGQILLEESVPKMVHYFLNVFP